MASLKVALHDARNLNVVQLNEIRRNESANPMMRSVCRWALEDTARFVKLLLVTGLVTARPRHRHIGTNSRILKQLESAPDGVFITDIQLSQAADRSLHSVRRAIGDLRKEGFPIHTKHKQGYRLGVGASNLTLL